MIIYRFYFTHIMSGEETMYTFNVGTLVHISISSTQYLDGTTVYHTKY